MARTHHTSTFDKIPANKQERILEAATEALGREGAGGIRMGEIAVAAGISHGSLFSYFPSKDHLIRAVIARGAAMEQRQFADAPLAPFDTAVHTALQRAWQTAEAEDNLISFWLSLSLKENERFATDIIPMEQEGAEHWLTMVQKAQDSGELPRGPDPRVLAFVLDAVMAQLLKSRASELEKNKFDFFFEGEEDPVALISRTIQHLLTSTK